MTAEIMINKVVITEAAKFDYEEVVARQSIPKTAIKNECELYIDNLQNGGRLLNGYYFRAKYYDENSDKMLILFFYKGERFGKMQLWKLSGICEADDWTEEQEDDGQIRFWLKSMIADLPKDDWVWDYRLKTAKQKRMLEEVEHENYGEDYKRMVKAILKNYRLNVSRATVGNKDDSEVAVLVDKMEFLLKCVDTLDEESKEIITDIYIKGGSLKKVGDKHGYSKTSMFRKRDRAIEILEILFTERYSN